MVLPIIRPLKKKVTWKTHAFSTRLLENTGGAGGFYEGVKRAYEAGLMVVADGWWCWTSTDALEKLSEYCRNQT